MFRIFIPTDLSPNAANALRYALHLSKRLDAKLNIFHGIVLPVPMGDIPVIATPGEQAVHRKVVEKNVNRIFKSARLKPKDNRVEIMLAEDFAMAPLIRRMAEDSKADLIVMGTKGASGAKKVLFGSNAVEVISHTHLPVLAVPQYHRFKPIRKIVMPSDLKTLQKELKEVLPFAKLFNANLEVMFMSDGSEEAMKRYDAAMKVVKKNAHKKIKLTIEGIHFGEGISSNIEKALKNRKPDLLVMFRHEHNWLGNLFLTSKTDQLAFAAKMPLLALREPE